MWRCCDKCQKVFGYKYEDEKTDNENSNDVYIVCPECGNKVYIEHSKDN